MTSSSNIPKMQNRPEHNNDAAASPKAGDRSDSSADSAEEMNETGQLDFVLVECTGGDPKMNKEAIAEETIAKTSGVLDLLLESKIRPEIKVGKARRCRATVFEPFRSELKRTRSCGMRHKIRAIGIMKVPKLVMKSVNIPREVRVVESRTANRHVWTATKTEVAKTVADDEIESHGGALRSLFGFALTMANV